VLKERLPKEVRLNGTCSSGADDDRNDRVLLRVVICRQSRHEVARGQAIKRLSDPGGMQG